MSKFPSFIQFDSKDCGPSCIKIVLKYYNKEFPLYILRELCQTTRIGSTLKNINEAVNKLGFDSLILKLNFEELKNLPLPAIVHWNKEHYVVLYNVTEDKVQISDPAFGLINYTFEEFKGYWINDLNSNEGIILLLEQNENFEQNINDYLTQKKDESNSRLKSILRNPLSIYKVFDIDFTNKFRSVKIHLILSLVLGIIVQFLFPILTQSLVDKGIYNFDLNFIYAILFFQLFLFIGKTLNEVYRSWFLLEISSRLNISFISNFFLKLMNLPLSYFDIKLTGDLLQRIDDHKRIEKILTSSLLEFVQSLLVILVFAILLLYYNFFVFISFITISLIQIGWTFLFLKKREILDYKRFSTVSQERSRVIELINGMHEIKLNNAEKSKRWAWEDLQVKLFGISLESLKLGLLQNNGSQFINELKNIVITALCAVLVINEELTLGGLLAISYIVGQLSSPIFFFTELFMQLQDAKISFHRILEIHNLPTENSGKEKLGLPSTICFENLSFKYKGTENYVLKDISFTIPKNGVTAIVGSSGSGKTTLIKILLKYYTDYEGSLKINNKNFNDISTEKWRESVGTVLQEGYIFNDTIINNICLNKSYLDIDKYKKSVQLACIEEFIETLPYQFNTKIGNEGVGLSGGQKQRILIARAIYNSPNVIIFDEATSSLDATNEKDVISNLLDNFSNKTLIIVAHRLSTVKNANQIIVLDNGCIAEIGTHDELINRSGKYYNLVRDQLELN